LRKKLSEAKVMAKVNELKRKVDCLTEGEEKNLEERKNLRIDLDQVSEKQNLSKMKENARGLALPLDFPTYQNSNIHNFKAFIDLHK
jgi:hypothetical protein